MSRIAVLTDVTDAGLAAAVAGLARHLARTGLDVVSWPAEAETVLVYSDRPPDERLEETLAGHRLLLAGPTPAAWSGVAAVAERAGVLTGAPTPLHETRLRPGRDAGDLAARLAGDVLLTDTWPLADKVLDDVEVLLTAYAGLAEHAVMTWRGTGVGLFSLGARAETVRDPAYQRLVHRWVRRGLDLVDGAPVRVGLLGYGAIGHEHNKAVAAVDGLVLSAVCDANPVRVEAARTLTPDVTAYADGEALLSADDVDLVVVSTPPNSHADWALRALRAGKHVVVEKPFCLTTAEADEMIAAAADGGLALAVYQNRRWDRDYLTVKNVVRSGAIGEVFHYESFVGGYGHPCNFWHSDADVSGGAIYDWGSHHLDWVLDLMPQQIAHVSAAEHKRLWHDVTNADHSRVTVRFTDGVEAEFTHSDLAAAMKPKWYVLGTRGAIVGDWRHERVVARDAVGNLLEDRLAAAEAPADLSLHAPDGSTTVLALAAAPPQPFHRELADRLLSGAPMSVTPEGSRRNIAVMEAATRSARQDGRPVVPSGS